MLYAILAVALVIIDQITKYLVRANIAPGEYVTFIPGLLDLTYVKNTGAAFSILREHTWLLTLISAAMVVVIALLVSKKFFATRLGLLSAALIMAGAVGNLIDRVVFKYVTDMISTAFMNFPVFNVADCCITAGAVLMCVYVLFFHDKAHEKEADSHGTDLPADHN